MISLYNGESDEEVGQITEAQLDFLQENLGEETLDANSYNITPAVVSSLENLGADTALIGILRKALGSRSSIELRYDPE
jgi:hypothetical protein